MIPIFGRRPVWLSALALLLAGIVSGAAWQLGDYWARSNDLSGFVRVIDGDSLMVGRTEVRLYGIDAPELVQTCQRDGRDVPCGREAFRALVALVGGQSVSCKTRAQDRYHRTVAMCFAEGVDLGQAMVMAGNAVGFGHYNKEEAAARNERKGLWAGDFTRPAEWRRRQGPRMDNTR